MKINVTPSMNFWKHERVFWTFRSKPRCMIGEELIFICEGIPIARAEASGIQPPGISGDCFLDHWKVFWKPESFLIIPPALFQEMKEKFGKPI